MTKNNKIRKEWYKTAFVDPGGSVDEYFLTICKVNVATQMIYIMGAKSWRLVEGVIGFKEIREDVAKLNKIYEFDMFGCEKNNYGLSEIEAYKREYKMRVIGITTSPRLTSEKIIKSGTTMDKHQIIRWVNSWRTANKIIKPKHITDPELKKLLNQFDTFIVKPTKTGNPKYEAEGQNRDDGVMSLLGNIFMIKTRILKIAGFQRAGASKKLALYHNGNARDELLESGLSGSQTATSRPYTRWGTNDRGPSSYRIR